MQSETVCAAATSPLNSAIAVIRISGFDLKDTAGSYFTNSRFIDHRKSVFGSFIDDGSVVDDVLLTYFKSPNSYTGEDVIEISCHGNFLIVQKILKALQKKGIRMAEPGEFTKRAFINGKMDLTEAEAVNKVINSRSDWEIRTSLKQMHGSLKNIIADIRENIIELKADVECGIDFLEEDIEFISKPDAVKKISIISDNLEDLLRRCVTGERLSHGINVGIVGKPNVGKSSILNLILNTERAIVSNIPGTTRDVIKETIQIGGIHVNLIDTAGIHDSNDKIERIGIDRSLQTIKDSFVVLAVFDCSENFDEKDEKILENIINKNCIFILNKYDKKNNDVIKLLSEKTGSRGAAIEFSAISGHGMKVLEKNIQDIIIKNFEGYQDGFIADIRVIGLLEKSISNCRSIINVLENEEPVEIIAFEIQQLINTILEITGDISPDDILESVFSRFCIGK